jgi:hypothetical protein
MMQSSCTLQSFILEVYAWCVDLQCSYFISEKCDWDTCLQPYNQEKKNLKMQSRGNYYRYMSFLREFIGMKFVACLAASLSLVKTRSAILLPIFCLSTCEGIDRLIIKLWEGWNCRSAFNQMRWIFSSPDLKAHPLSVVCLSIRLTSVCYTFTISTSYPKPLGQLGKGDSELFIWRTPPFPRGDNSKSKNTLKNFKNLLLQNQQVNFNTNFVQIILG